MRTILRFTLIAALLPGLAAAQTSARTASPVGAQRPEVVVPGPSSAPPSKGFVPREPMEVERVPRVTSIGGQLFHDAQGRSAFQFFLRTHLEISLTGLGAAGEVRMRLVPWIGAGADRSQNCQFTDEQGLSPTGPAVIAPEGTARVQLPGVFRPLSMSKAAITGTGGTCRLKLLVQRRQVDMAYRDEVEVRVPEIPIAPHEAVEIRDTARLRGFLRPVPSPECEADDGDGKFGQRIKARAGGGGGCRTDFLDPRDKFNSPRLNVLGEGLILDRMAWRLEGDRQACQLCDNPLLPCRAAGGNLSLTAEYAFYLRWVYAPLRDTRIGDMPGVMFSVFGGPPELGRNTAVRVNTRGFYYDTAWLDVVEGLFNNPSGTEGNDVIGVGDGRWRSWMRPFGVRLQCSPWVPPPAQVARQLGGMARGVSTPPQPPSLRLVLDSATFLRPAGRAIPGG